MSIPSSLSSEDFSAHVGKTKPNHISIQQHSFVFNYPEQKMELLRKMHTVQGLLSFVLQCLKPSNGPEEADMLLLHAFLFTENCWKLLLPL